MATITASFMSLFGPPPPAVRRAAPVGFTLLEPRPRPVDERADEELIGLFRRHRDPDAFAALVRRYEHELFGYLVRRLGRADLAEEAFKRTFLGVHQRPPACDGGRSFRGWLYWLATREAHG
jgi:RNA polymerase sigma-70 factor (ECF subfamily)